MNKEYSEALEYVNGKIADLEDDLQHYTMVEKDKCREFYIREDLKQFINIQQALQHLEAIDNANPSEALECLEEILNKAFDYGVQFTLDNLFVRGYDTRKMLDQVYLGNTLTKDLEKNRKLLSDLKSDIIKQTIIKSQEDEEENKFLYDTLITVSEQYTNLMLEYQEQKKVLEIIKNIIKFGDDLSAILNFDTYEKYNEWSWGYDLTREEFDLLKRLIVCQKN